MSGEADKISRKHLLTLGPGISEPQTDQMEASSLQVVAPRDIHGSFTDAKRAWLWDLGNFIGHLKRGRYDVGVCRTMAV